LPTDVQDEAIPLILGGGDVLVRFRFRLATHYPHNIETCYFSIHHHHHHDADDDADDDDDRLRRRLVVVRQVHLQSQFYKSYSRPLMVGYHH
jgi:hypothetical protein